MRMTQGISVTMNARTFLVLGLGCLVISLLTGCGPAAARCAKCGMRVADHPRWVAGAITAAGVEERFCCPRCMFVWHHSRDGAGSRDLWVTEYYAQKRMPAADVFFVMGSDVAGPMGKALVPVAGREEAGRFLKDHAGARLLQAQEITPELLRELAGKPPEPIRP